MPDPGIDPLSPLAHDIIKAATYEKLVVREGTQIGVSRLLGSLTPDQLLSIPITSDSHAYAMLAGLWLWHDALDECHKIAQMEPQSIPRGKASRLSQIETVEEADGAKHQQQLADAALSLSFWHAIMHRREGDFSNSQYWYAKCRSHPIIATMGPTASQLIHPLPADKHLLRLISNGWDTNAFVDFVQMVHDHPTDPRREIARSLQQMEWRLLFDHCTRAAVSQ